MSRISKYNEERHKAMEKAEREGGKKGNITTKSKH